MYFGLVGIETYFESQLMFYMHIDISFGLLFQSLHLITSGHEAPMMRWKVIVIY